MKWYFISIFLLFSFFIGFSQEPIVKNYSDFETFLSEQNGNLENIGIGLNSEEVTAIMGSSIILKIPKVGRKRKLNQLFKQPEFTNQFNRGKSKKIKVLWYFSTPKNEDGIISKRECTPVVIQNDSVIGKGWDFFNKFRKTLTAR